MGRGRRDRDQFPVAGIDPPHGPALFVEDKPVEVLGYIGQCESPLGMCDAGDSDEKAEPVLLLGGAVFDRGTGRRCRGIGLPTGFAPLNAANQMHVTE